MAQTIRCPACGHEISAGAELAGMTVECPKCGAPFDVPGRPPQIAPEARPRPSPPPSPATEPPPAWDLPESPTPDPRAPLRDEKQRQFRIVVAAGVAILVAVLSLLLALRLKRGLSPPPPGPEMTPMNQDVDVGGFRCRVSAAEWREEPGGTPGTARQQVLDIHLTVVNRDDVARVMPLVMLGDRWGKSLAADFGTPAFTTEDGRPVGKLAPGETVRAHVVFQPRFAEYCLIVSVDAGGRGVETARVRLEARMAPSLR